MKIHRCCQTILNFYLYQIWEMPKAEIESCKVYLTSNLSTSVTNYDTNRCHCFGISAHGWYSALSHSWLLKFEFSIWNKMAFAHNMAQQKLDREPWLLASVTSFVTKLSDNHVSFVSLKHLSLLSLKFIWDLTNKLILQWMILVCKRYCR